MPTLQSILAQAAGLSGDAPSLRDLLADMVAKTERSSYEYTRQVEEVDRDKLQARIERMVDRACIIAHAFDVMNQEQYPHPLEAFLHSTDCIGQNIDDTEFAYLLTLWGKINGECLKTNVEELPLITRENVHTHSTEVLRKAHSSLGVADIGNVAIADLRGYIAAELLRRQGFGE